ncbi:MAG: excinuclease ABC subunit UvrC [Pseudomonadota bacterium]
MFDHKNFLSTLTTCPGVYQMFDREGCLIYVGKAKNLKKRVTQYFQKKRQDLKTIALVAHIVSIAVIVTQTESDALLLETDLIQKHHPHYNIDFRDDKSYPYIALSQDDYPRLFFYRGARKELAHYFGPYPHGGYVKSTVMLLQKLFRIRSCKNTFFRSRTRPCLQYQIGRCSAPCVNFISQNDYANDIRYVKLFLEGKNQEIIQELTRRMNAASRQLQYEEALHYRNQIHELREMQKTQTLRVQNSNIDVVAIAQKLEVSCVAILIIRFGRVLGCKTLFPKRNINANLCEVLTSFVQQYYLNLSAEEMPNEIIVNDKIDQVKLMSAAINTRVKHKVTIKQQVKGARAAWINMALSSAQQALQTRLSTNADIHQKLLDLKEFCKLPHTPKRIECFDISHTMGAETIASCVVFTDRGLIKKDYRRFNIDDIVPGDDYAAMQQAMRRRYARLKTEEKPLPDIVIVDGGKGQLTQAMNVFEELQMDDVILMGIAKGEGRKVGLETIYFSHTQQPFHLAMDSLAFRLIQQIRDEAHRFAITGHRAKRNKYQRHSILEDIADIGKKRRLALLTHFGGLQGVKNASVQDLSKVPGVSQTLARQIYDALHGKVE